MPKAQAFQKLVANLRGSGEARSSAAESAAAAGFKRLVSQVVGVRLRSLGFTRRETTFYFRRQGNWGVVNFQQNPKADPETVEFTVNLGVASARLLDFFPPPGPDNSAPEVWDCHWKVRLGQLLSGRSDQWWTIRANTNVVALGEELREQIVAPGLPAIERHLDDAVLRDLWLTEEPEGLTYVQRVMYLAVILKAIGPEELLDLTVDELRQISAGKPGEVNVEFFLDKLNSSSFS